MRRTFGLPSATPMSDSPDVSPSPRAGAVTRLLRDAERGGADDLVERLLPLVYDELRALARAQRRRGAPQTLVTTALVHEAYLRLVRGDLVPDRRYVFAAAARAMRNVLVDHARYYARQKRGRPATLHPGAGGAAPADATEREAARLIDIDAALVRLADFDARAARVVECRFFGGLSVDETAGALDVSPATVKRDWRRARAWLHTQLGDDLAPTALPPADPAAPPTTEGG